MNFNNNCTQKPKSIHHSLKAVFKDVLIHYLFVE